MIRTQHCQRKRADADNPQSWRYVQAGEEIKYGKQSNCAYRCPYHVVTAAAMQRYIKCQGREDLGQAWPKVIPPVLAGGVSFY